MDRQLFELLQDHYFQYYLSLAGVDRFVPLEALPRYHRGLSFTDGDTVYISPDLLRADHCERRPVTLQLVLAHEAVHVAQYESKDKPIGSLHCLEADAATGSLHLLSGERYQAQFKSDQGRLHWGRAGHFYTVFSLALAAGAAETDAWWMAVCAQVPDLVSEFDAITQTIFQNAYVAGIDPSEAVRLGAQWAPHPSPPPANPETCTDIIEGLHALTGRDSTSERNIREGILIASTWPSLSFGLGMHAFGDSFAHCDHKELQMYERFVGHALHSHEPDLVSENIDTYTLYIQRLYRVLDHKIASRNRLSEKEVTLLLKNIFLSSPTMDDTEMKQINQLRGLGRDLLTRDKGLADKYRPGYDCVPLSRFRSQAGGRGFSMENAAEAYRLAKQWRVSTTPLSEYKREADAIKRSLGPPHRHF